MFLLCCYTLLICYRVYSGGCKGTIGRQFENSEYINKLINSFREEIKYTNEPGYMKLLKINFF